MKLKNVVVGSKIEAKTDDNIQGEFIKGDLVRVIYKEPDSYRGELTIRVELDSWETSWQSHKDFRKPRVVAPKLKKLDQSIFDGVDSRYSYFAIDEDGRGGFYDHKPELCGDCFTSGYGWRQVGQYDASNWQNSLIERDIAKELLEVDLSSELTGSDLALELLKNQRYIIASVSDVSDADAIECGNNKLIHKSSEDIFTDDMGGIYCWAVALNNQGEPLTAAEVGL